MRIVSHHSRNNLGCAGSVLLLSRNKLHSHSSSHSLKLEKEFAICTHQYFDQPLSKIPTRFFFLNPLSLSLSLSLYIYIYLFIFSLPTIICSTGLTFLLWSLYIIGLSHWFLGSYVVFCFPHSLM